MSVYDIFQKSKMTAERAMRATIPPVPILTLELAAPLVFDAPEAGLLWVPAFAEADFDDTAEARPEEDASVDLAGLPLVLPLLVPLPEPPFPRVST